MTDYSVSLNIVIMKQYLKAAKLNVELTKELINEHFISTKINSRGREVSVVLGKVVRYVQVMTFDRTKTTPSSLPI
jgi:hypothetical protein